MAYGDTGEAITPGPLSGTYAFTATSVDWGPYAQPDSFVHPVEGSDNTWGLTLSASGGGGSWTCTGVTIDTASPDFNAIPPDDATEEQVTAGELYATLVARVTSGSNSGTEYTRRNTGDALIQIVNGTSDWIFSTADWEANQGETYVMRLYLNHVKWTKGCGGTDGANTANETTTTALSGIYAESSSLTFPSAPVDAGTESLTSISNSTTSTASMSSTLAGGAFPHNVSGTATNTLNGFGFSVSSISLDVVTEGFEGPDECNCDANLSNYPQMSNGFLYIGNHGIYTDLDSYEVSLDDAYNNFYDTDVCVLITVGAFLDTADEGLIHVLDFEVIVNNPPTGFSDKIVLSGVVKREYTASTGSGTPDEFCLRIPADCYEDIEIRVSANYGDSTGFTGNSGFEVEVDIRWDDSTGCTS